MENENMKNIIKLLTYAKADLQIMIATMELYPSTHFSYVLEKVKDMVGDALECAKEQDKNGN